MTKIRAAVIDSAKRAALRELEGARKEAGIHHSRYPGNSAAIRLVSGEAEKGFERASIAAANRIAEIEGPGAIAYADALSELLRPLQETFFEIMVPGIFGPHNTMSNMLGEAPNELRRRLSQQLEATVDDLRLGIAGGANVDKSKSRIINIDNRQGSGQFAVDSNHVHQSVGRDQRNDSSLATSEDLIKLLAELRAGVRRGEAPEAIAADIDDAAVSIERELAQPAPDASRVKRLLVGLGKFTKEVGAAAIGHTIAGLILAGQHISG